MQGPHARYLRPSHRFRTRRVVVLHQIHPAADFVLPHQRRVERLQQVADGIGLLKAGVEPQVVGVIGQDDGHTVQIATTRNVVTTPST